MKKAWSLFWLVVVSIIVLNIVFSLIRPWIISIAIGVLILAIIASGVAIWRFIGKRRRFF